VTLDPDHVEARYEQGVLTLTIPAAEAANPRRVTIAAGQGDDTALDSKATAIEADAS